MQGLAFLLFFVLVFCAYTDIKERKIKNCIVFPLMLTGIVYNGIQNGWQGIFFALYGMMIALPLLFMAFGMGDVKLLMGIGAIKGIVFSLDVLFFAIIFSILMGVVISPKKAIKIIQNIYIIFRNIFYFRDFSKLSQNKGLLMPFAPFVLLGYIFAIAVGGDIVWSLIK